jgi:hypothetical protein
MSQQRNAGEARTADTSRAAKELEAFRVREQANAIKAGYQLTT